MRLAFGFPISPVRFENSDRARCRRRSFWCSPSVRSVPRPAWPAQAQDKGATLERPHRGINSLRALTLFCVAALHLVFWKIFLMEVNDKVADFTLQTEEDKTVHLKDFAGKPVVLFFYPKADTPGCTIEAWAFVTSSKRYSRRGPLFSVSRATHLRRRRNSKRSSTCPTPSLQM